MSARYRSTYCAPAEFPLTAHDAKTLQEVWSYNTGSGINAQPITYTYKGRQYVSIQSGFGGVNAARQAALTTNIPRGGSVWTFALMD